MDTGLTGGAGGKTQGKNVNKVCHHKSGSPIDTKKAATKMVAAFYMCKGYKKDVLRFR